MIATPTRKPCRGDYVTVFLKPPAIQPISGRIDRIYDSAGERYYVIWWVWRRVWATIPHRRLAQMFKLPRPLQPL